MKRMLIAVVIIGFGYQASAQISTFLEPGKSGAGIRAVGEQGIGFYGFGGGLTASVKGKLDIDFIYTHDTYNQDGIEMISETAPANYFSGRMRYWIFRERIHPAIDVNFAVSGGAEYANITASKVMDGTSEILEYDRFNALELGFGTNVDFHMPHKWIVEPSLFFSYEVGMEYWKEGQAPKKESSTGINGVFGLSLIRRTDKGAFFIQANQYIESGLSGNWWNFAVGYAFSF